MIELDNDAYRIGLIEPSQIITEGLSNILLKAGNFDLYQIDNVADLPQYISANHLQMIIINPMMILPYTKELGRLRRKFPFVVWVALVYNYFDNKILSQFNINIQITDPPEQIINDITSQLTYDGVGRSYDPELLTDRELEIIRLIVQGYINKEIADKLNISVHTVVSHRKNISQKTGIKTQAGLTIFALSNNLVGMQRE